MPYTARCVLRPLLALSIAFAAVGCASGVPATDAGGDAAQAAGLGEAIRFRIEGDPVDVPGDGSDGDALGAAEVVRLALTRDPTIQAALARVHVARAEATRSRLLPNPVLSVVLRWPDGGGRPDIEAGLAADLVALLSRPGRVRVAGARLRAAAAEVLTITLDALAEVQARHVAVGAADDALSVIEDRVGILDRLLGIARSRLDAGEGTRLDVLALEAQRVELETERRERQLDRVEQRLVLNRLIGRPSASVDWPLRPWPLDESPLGPEPEWLAAAAERRPEILRQRFELMALGQEARLAAFGPFDGADVGLDAERGGGDWAAGPGVSLPLPLFDFGQARRGQARAAVVAARHDLTRVGRQVVEETRRAYAAVVASRENLARVGSELIPIAEQRLAQAEVQFRSGQTDTAGLLQAEEDLRTARLRLIELRQRSADALIRLQRAAGGPGSVRRSDATLAPEIPDHPTSKTATTQKD